VGVGEIQGGFTLKQGAGAGGGVAVDHALGR